MKTMNYYPTKRAVQVLEDVTKIINKILRVGTIDAIEYSSTLVDVINYCSRDSTTPRCTRVTLLYTTICQEVGLYLLEQSKHINIFKLDAFGNKYKHCCRTIKHLMNYPERYQSPTDLERLYLQHPQEFMQLGYTLEELLEHPYQNIFLPIINQRIIVYNQRMAFICGFYDEKSTISKLPMELVWMICEWV